MIATRRPSWLQFTAHAAIAGAVYFLVIPERLLFALPLYMVCAHVARALLATYDKPFPPQE